MRIRLCNFRCYTDNTFDFGESGLTLLSGSSGEGKSSIMMGIQFALYGTGTKIISHGKASCTVELTFADMYIVRTKRPNHLVVNGTHEDQAGQSLIDEKFGNTFDVTGYIAQNTMNSFVMMSPIDKLGFLERFAFKNVDICALKGKCKEYISETRDALISATSQLDLFSGMKIDKPENIPFPFKCKSGSEEKYIRNAEIRLKNTNILIKRNAKKSKDIADELNAVKIHIATMAGLYEKRDGLKEIVSGEKINVERYENAYAGDDILAKHKYRLKWILSRRELTRLEDRYKQDVQILDAMRVEEIRAIQTEIDYITPWGEYSKSDLDDSIASYRECMADAEHIMRLQNEFDKLCKRDKLDTQHTHTMLAEKKQLKLDLEAKIKKKKRYCCPVCKNRLVAVDDRVLEIDKSEGEDTADNIIIIDRAKKELRAVLLSIEELEADIEAEKDRVSRMAKLQVEIDEITCRNDPEMIRDISELKDNLDYFCDYKASQLVLEKQKTALELSLKMATENPSKALSSSYKSVHTSVQSLKKAIDSLILNYPNSPPTNPTHHITDEEELRSVIISEEKAGESLLESKKKLKQAQDELGIVSERIEAVNRSHMETYGEIRMESVLEKEQYECSLTQATLESDKISHESVLQDIEKWRCYRLKLDEYETYNKKLASLVLAEEEKRSNHTAACILREKIIEAESISMIHIIESINTHASAFLEMFFQSDPISVQIAPFKAVKKGVKPQINMEVEYRGMECDINSLSGGELSRVILAFTLALGEMFNTPLILLDECTASLDQDLSEIVFSSIRDVVARHSLVIIIAHQVVTGIFDRTIALGSETDECHPDS